MHKYVFGPVPSKRLGRSLGIDLTPQKTCTLNCRYCQISAEKNLALKRTTFCPPGEVIKELEKVLSQIEPPDWITFSGTGEPTLHIDLGFLIKSIKNLNIAPVCVITNGTLLSREEVRADLMLADRVLPTLCSVFPETFIKIHRPLAGIEPEEVLEGLVAFSREYQGILEIEIVDCPGLNDSDAEISGIRKFLECLPRVHSIYLNTAVRPPQDVSIRSATREEIFIFKEKLGKAIPVTTVFDPGDLPSPTAVETFSKPRKAKISPDEVFSLLLRHPCTKDQIIIALGGEISEISNLLEELNMQKRIKKEANGIWVPICSSVF
ncbi:radical SAM protein [bacterium]|nr:radical SAM protein [bacterium]